MSNILPYDTETEVTEKQYHKAVIHCEGIIAHRSEDGKYYIKLLLTKYRDYVLQILAL